jgi:hypothetical protein
MARYIEYSAADSATAIIEFTTEEFEGFLEFSSRSGIGTPQIEMLRKCGFLAPVQRVGFEWLFEACKAGDAIAVLGICRAGSWPALKQFIESTAKNSRA